MLQRVFTVDLCYRMAESIYSRSVLQDGRVFTVDLCYRTAESIYSRSVLQDGREYLQ